MKAAIWGSLNHGNFGDDVMNVMVGIVIKNKGFTPYVYRLNQKLADKYGLISVNTLDELHQDAAFSIIGGGSWLESIPLGKNYETDFDDYILSLEKYKTPYYVVSIGGDNTNGFDKLSDDRKKLFSNPLFMGGTVRLKGDLKTLSNLKKEVELYPDIVLSSDKFFLKQKIERNPNVTQIGISAAPSRTLKWGAYMLDLLPFWKHIKVYFLRTHLPEYNYTYEFQYGKNSENVKNFQYEDLESFYSFVSTLDVMICSKLHPGVATLSTGGAFLWLTGNDKVRAFLKSIKQDENEYSIKKIMKLILEKKIIPEINTLDKRELLRQKDESWGHIKFIEKICDRYLQN